MLFFYFLTFSMLFSFSQSKITEDIGLNGLGRNLKYLTNDDNELKEAAKESANPEKSKADLELKDKVSKSKIDPELKEKDSKSKVDFEFNVNDTKSKVDLELKDKDSKSNVDLELKDKDSLIIRLTNISLNTHILVNTTENYGAVNETTTKADNSSKTHALTLVKEEPLKIMLQNISDKEVSTTELSVEEETTMSVVNLVNSTNEATTNSARKTTTNPASKITTNPTVNATEIRFRSQDNDTSTSTTPKALDSSSHGAKNEAALDISIKMKATDDALSLLEVNTNQTDDGIDDKTLSSLLKNFANRFINRLRGFFLYRRRNEEVKREPVENYNLYVPISEDAPNSRVIPSDKQHHTVLREGLSLLGDERD